tara:strand:+ start:409 stop:756 length:348 start_codon:yes stop_codon:yes gene_type:complete
MVFKRKTVAEKEKAKTKKAKKRAAKLGISKQAQEASAKYQQQAQATNNKRRTYRLDRLEQKATNLQKQVQAGAKATPASKQKLQAPKKKKKKKPTVYGMSAKDIKNKFKKKYGGA